MTHGGKRSGAGRPPTSTPNKIMVSKKLDPILVDYLKSQDNATDVLETAIRRSKHFRDWLHAKKKGM